MSAEKYGANRERSELPATVRPETATTVLATTGGRGIDNKTWNRSGAVAARPWQTGRSWVRVPPAVLTKYKTMEISIKFKPQGKPENDLVSFSFEDIKVKDLRIILSQLPEILAKVYAGTVAASSSKKSREAAEGFILRCCNPQIYQADTRPCQAAVDNPQIP